MRSVVSVAACVALLLVGAVSAIDAQAQARAIEDRWKNCSQIVHGRLGALHDADGDAVTPGFSTMGNSDYTFHFSPCVLTSAGNFLTVRSLWGGGVDSTFTQVIAPSGATTSTQERFITFNMPQKSGEVANIVVAYQADAIDKTTIMVTVSCNPAAIQANVTAYNRTGPVHYLSIDSVTGCARFPYTNKSVPPGGVAAIIVVIICFILQFGACFKYHRDNKNTSPLDEETMH